MAMSTTRRFLCYMAWWGHVGVIKKLIKWTHNDTQNQKSTNPKISPIDCDGVQLTNPMSHGTYIHIMIQRKLNYTIEIPNWNQARKNNNIVLSETS